MIKSSTMIAKKYYWDPETISYFVDLYHKKGEAYMLTMLILYVKCDCQLEDNETHQDLNDDLMNRVYESIND